ncbi:MAG: cell wall-binding repeat-containing protein [Gracilibacteraceae bacterium]|jgi:putative cell wall-binding protein|nr:cell wall-binding repeat-containing protein [Gracilibacteraceae bacterium]
MKLKRNMAILLSVLLLLAQLPLGAFAFEPRQGAAGVRSGVYTAGDDAVYAVLYNDYITLYVNKLNGGFAALPATESFDGAKPLSRATFRIDGEAYDYGAYYSGVSGAVSMAPEVNENGILESHWQIGDFVISQIFAITSDALHDNSYAVKVGYSAQYFGEGSANIAGRILLDTQFTPDESVPVMLLDDADNAVLIESAAALSAGPAAAFVSKEFIEESNLESESPVFADSPNKGYLLFADDAFAAPDRVTFAAFAGACDADYDYTPADVALFDGSGADSAALLYWNEVSVSNGNQAAFGTNYGFYDLKRGNPRFDPAPAVSARSAGLRSAMSAMSVESAAATVNIWNIDQLIPDNWFEIKTSVALNKETRDYNQSFMRGTVAEGVDWQISLDYRSGTPQIIKDTVKKYNLWIGWDGGSEWNGVNAELAVGEFYTLDTAAAFTKRNTVENAEGETVPADLSVAITPIVETPAGHTLVSAGLSGSGAALSLTGAGSDDAVLYGKDSIYISADLYIVKTDAAPKLTVEMAGLQYKISDDTNVYQYNPEVRWDHAAPAALPSTPGDDLKGPLTYTYTFGIPAGAERGDITVFTENSGAIVPQPVNIKAYHSQTSAQTAIEDLLYSDSAVSGTGVTRDQGIIWAAPGETVSVDTTSILNVYSGGTFYVYKAGTKTLAATISSDSFTMPNEPVDLVYENGNVYRVLTEVTGGGSATVVVNSDHGATPQVGDKVSIYVTNIADGCGINTVTATGGNVILVHQPGDSRTFTMPNSDVTVTVNLKTVTPPTYHSVIVKPLAGESMTVYDVMFWTDAATGGRQVYEVDEAGRSGQVPAGATVRYVVYPTNWDTAAGNVDNMENWAVADFTLNGTTVSGFAGINTGKDGHDNIGYFPYNYNPSGSQNTGSFTMPDEDVILELTGYKKTRVYSLTLEAYDEYGNRLSLPENTVRSAAVDPSKVYDSISFSAPPWNEGLHVEAFMDEFLRLEVPQQFDRYTLESAEVMIGGASAMPLTALGGAWQADWPVSGLVARYYFQPMFQNNAIVRLTYAVKYNRLNITGFEPEEWNVYRPGEVRVLEGAGRSDIRALNVLRDDAGQGSAELTLDWSRTGDGIDYMLPASGTGFTTSLLHAKGGSATYTVMVTAPEASIAIQEKPVAPSLNLSDGVTVNSANANTFKTVNLHAGYYKMDEDGKTGYSENLKNLLSGNPAPKITEMTLASEKTQADFPKKVTGDVYANKNAAFSWPQNEFRDDFTGARNGQLMALDLRSLFGIDGEYSFPEGNYTLTVEWAYGDGLRESGEKSYTFYLSPTIYAPGELTHIGIVKVEYYGPEDVNAHPGIEQGNWIVVTGISREDMLATAARFTDSPPLLTFVNDSVYGFYMNFKDHDFWGQGSIVMNGHAYFKSLLSGAGDFYIDENSDGSVTVESYEMTFGGKSIPVWVPLQIGGNNGYRFGTNTLKIDIEKGKNYTIPYEIPEYHKGNNATAGNEGYAGDPNDIPAELRWTGNSVSVKIGEYEMEGLTADYRAIYLLSHGFDIGGQINVQIPGTKDPVFRVELVSLVTDNTAKLIPIDNVWAEGTGTVKLPDVIGGYGGQASGVFNTFTQDFGFEAMVNFKVIELSGEFYLARSERFKIPVLDRFVVSVGIDGLAIGAGLPPAPVQIIEINGITVGVTNLADTFDYDPRRNTIPSMRIIVGGKFKLVEVLGFEAEMWSEMFSGGYTVEGNLEIGPFAFPLIKELSLAYGMKDGPFEPYEDAGLIVKGKRSLLFFINATCHVSLLGIVDGAGGFSVNMTISPALWEKRGGFASVKEVLDFISLNITANGYLFASLNVPFTDWTIADADVRVDIVFEPGMDLDVAPFGFKKFEFVATERFLGMKVGEDRIDLMKYYSGLTDWLKKEVEKQKNKTKSYAAQSLSEDASMLQLMAMNDFLADPEASGLEPDPNYKGEHRDLAFGAAVADSERGVTPPVPVPSGRMGLRAITQDTAHIKVEAGLSSYTHSVTVPNDGKDYMLQMEGYGSDALTFADVQVFKPGGQALTVRELSGEVTAAQAAFGYNAAVIDGVLTLSLADFKNATAGTGGDTVSGVGGTLRGEWQVVSQKPFKSSLVAINTLPGVKSAGLSGSTLNMEFENVTVNDDYYYDVTVERKSDAGAPPLEALTIVKNAPVTALSASLDLTQIKIADVTFGTDTYDIAEIAGSGDWYPRVTLRQGGMESYTIVDGTGSETTEDFLITEYVDDKICAEPYAVVNTTLAAASWTPGLQAVSGGNQSIDVSFAPATAPSGMTVSGYHVAVYDENGLPVSRRATDAEGSQRATLMEYDILAGEDDPARYEYNIPDIPIGNYTVGAAPLYADLIPETENGAATGKYVASGVSRKGAAEKSGLITIAAANPPTLAFSVTGGALVEENGSKYVFAGEEAALTATATDGATATYCEFDGTELTAADGTLTNLTAYSGRTLIITARNAQGDSTTEYLTVYADTTAPLLLPDNYDEGNGAFTFTAYKNTGNYTVTGQAAPGAVIGGAVAGDDGRFSFSGTLDSGEGSENFTLTAANAAGLVTMREINVVRGNVNESAGAPTPNGGTGGGGGGAQPPAAPVTVSRASLSYISGADRVLTSVAISRQGWESADAVILAPGGQNNLIDALAAAPLAGQENAPILLSTGTLDPAVVAEIQRLGAKKIYVVGAIGQDVISALRAALPGVTVEILQGSNRFETAALVSAKLTNPQGTFVVGYNAVADAVSAASFAAANGYAIQIANANGSASDDHDTTRVNPDLPVYILGGPTLVQDVPGATRLYGATRYETNKAIRDALAFEYTNIYTADGNTLVDALTGSALAAQTRAAIVLTPGNDPTGVDFGKITQETKVYAFGATK